MQTFVQFLAEAESESHHPMIDVDGVQKHRNNSEGKPIHKTDEGIRNFHRWFGNSKVTDKHGRPQVVYHGTNHVIKKVDPKKGAMGTFWFAHNKKHIEDGNSGAVGTKHITPMYAKIAKPAGWDEYGKKSGGELKRDGHDGAVLKEKDGDHTGFIFDSHQIKHATQNNGDFSTKSDHIRK